MEEGISKNSRNNTPLLGQQGGEAGLLMLLDRAAEADKFFYFFVFPREKLMNITL